jgi:hypothetical protein
MWEFLLLSASDVDLSLASEGGTHLTTPLQSTPLPEPDTYTGNSIPAGMTGQGTTLNRMQRTSSQNGMHETTLPSLPYELSY